MVVPPETADYTVATTGTPGFGNTVTVTFSPKPGVELDVARRLHPRVPGSTGELRDDDHDHRARGDDHDDTLPDETTTTIEKTLSFQVLGPICVADHPYIRWQLTATGLTPAQNLATITITDVNGNAVATLTDQPFNGQTLWPGASLDPEDWPGWVKIGGVWYTDPTDAVLRQGVYVRADVNPTAGPEFVAYPEATAACAQPESLEEVTTTSLALGSTLPVTGSSSAETAWIAAAFLAIGGLALVVARRRRPA